ncbi:primosomal protein N' [Haloplasma contractile]|uniref:Replication restart protein PriA n=1 Tax=Haloplasma contractile SSD-17B TaxID=1033810 RepID=U2DYU9_9MOLU|nr:primosomal protein N' [Haloplasma contractile]ERJ13417.1 Primosomal protein N [Haloplasma contractile SSD-17B]
MIAQVVVDVKNKNVNRTFDYEIPEELESIVEKGMRVIVPFANRLVMGYIIDFIESSTFNRLKQVEQVIDLVPSVNDELLTLAHKISKETASFLVSCIQVMLPTAIKASYQKRLIKNQALEAHELETYFNEKETIDYETVEANDLYKVKKEIQAGNIELKYVVKNKLKIKKEKYVKINELQDQTVETVTAKLSRSKKQQEAMIYLYQIKERGYTELLKKDLLDAVDLGTSSYNALLKKGYIREIEKESYRDPFRNDEVTERKRVTLNAEQQNVVRSVLESSIKDKQETFLLHGITGSGKTEVYLNIIKEVISKGKEAILLVPEISLTPQIVKRVRSYFNDEVAVLHSGLSQGEKYDEWRKILRKEVKVVVGARSAIFAPFTNIGVIIIDEEHESSYKQSDMPKYHAIEVAKWRANFHNCPVVLGSATPSLESHARAIKGVYNLLTLTKRATNMDLPNTSVVDMTNEFQNGNLSIFSDELKDAITEKLNKKEQIILLLNRRGYSNFVMCRNCGETVMCKNCDLSLTYHKRGDLLKCHYCGYERYLVKECPSCKSTHIRQFGIGTQKVEEELLTLWPDANVIRMDNDTTRKKGDHKRLLDRFGNQEADILLGTQMIAKGLDFLNVTLVGVLSADTTLKLPDFRSSEKTFQLITQVAGRAGRHKKKGEVIIQTYNPKHYAIHLASKQDYDSFFMKEMSVRKIGKYSPYYFLAQVQVSHFDYNKMMKDVHKIASLIRSNLSDQAITLGPVVSQISRINNRYYSQVIIKYKREPNLSPMLERLLEEYNTGGVNVIIDMYPTFLM